jgi:type IV fimbrial biogenesis protein FimT
MTRNGGFTLIELMLAIVVLAILVGVAVPSFTHTIDRNAATGAANDLLASIILARSEAVKREQRVHIRRQGADWSQWRVYADGNTTNGNTYDAVNDDLLMDYFHDGPVPAGNGGVATILSFSPRGRTIANLNSAADFFQVTQGDYTRYVCFSAIGRPRVQEGACP